MGTLGLVLCPREGQLTSSIVMISSLGPVSAVTHVAPTAAMISALVNKEPTAAVVIVCTLSNPVKLVRG